jgi:hypothetical protein
LLSPGSHWSLDEPTECLASLELRCLDGHREHAQVEQHRHAITAVVATKSPEIAAAAIVVPTEGGIAHGFGGRW